MIPMGFVAGPLSGTLASSTQPGPSGFADSARKQVRGILNGSQYQSRPQRSFQPLAGALGAIGRWFERTFGPAWRWVGHHFFHPLANWVTTDVGLPWPVTVLVVALVVGVVVGVILVRRRPRIDFEEIARSGVFAGDDPQKLEELAQQAEIAGDLRSAVRLRFRAGVGTLDRLGVINRGVTRTTRELSEALDSADFDVLAADLEAIVYGGVMATPEQAAVARSGWRTVTMEAAHKVEVERSSTGPTR
jgi:hypothetical protein